MNGEDTPAKPKRQKTNRASQTPKEAPTETQPAKPTTKDGKPVRKTASGFTVVG